MEIKIQTDSDAFKAWPSFELARILREYADHIQGLGDPHKSLRDINGNKVGQATIKVD